MPTYVKQYIQVITIRPHLSHHSSPNYFADLGSLNKFFRTTISMLSFMLDRFKTLRQSLRFESIYVSMCVHILKQYESVAGY